VVLVAMPWTRGQRLHRWRAVVHGDQEAATSTPAARHGAGERKQWAAPWKSLFGGAVHVLVVAHLHAVEVAMYLSASTKPPSPLIMKPAAVSVF